jgi:hypothetical protein
VEARQETLTDAESGRYTTASFAVAHQGWAQRAASNGTQQSRGEQLDIEPSIRSAGKLKRTLHISPTHKRNHYIRLSTRVTTCTQQQASNAIGALLTDLCWHDESLHQAMWPIYHKIIAGGDHQDVVRRTRCKGHMHREVGFPEGIYDIRGDVNQTPMNYRRTCPNTCRTEPCLINTLKRGSNITLRY